MPPITQNKSSKIRLKRLAGQLRFCGHKIIVACWISTFSASTPYPYPFRMSCLFSCRSTFFSFFSIVQDNFFVLFFQIDDISIIYGIWDKQTSGSWFNLYYALFIALYIRCLATTWIDIPTCLFWKEEGVGDAFKNMNAELWFYKFVPQARGQWQNLTVNVQACCKGELDRTGQNWTV